jgi:hypothetical protein
MNAQELEEEAQAVAWWIDPANSEARKELENRRPELAAWLSMIERKVAERMAEIEGQEEAKMKA